MNTITSSITSSSTRTDTISDSMALYNTTALKCSKLITQHYSTSFTLGIQTLNKKLHFPIYAIYGYVRYADEIVDTFHDKDRASLLARFREDTYRAIDEKISTNPVIHSFQLAVERYSIDKKLIEAFLNSMKMDLDKKEYDDNKYHEYIYGSAEVVGLMCLRVFCENDSTLYDSLEAGARSLGAAFQKVNFLRDMKSDFDERGRVYFPNINYLQFDANAKFEIENDIQKDFDAAYEAILRLPKTSRMGVYLAYIYYLKLFNKIKQSSTQTILSERIRVPDSKKIFLLVESYVKHRFNYI
ncbi:phytoene/squalene synthetase [Bernardetia litoralis DSM 6794]|uniref:Phytoene/squalene synthetase n=1 Tax=Bernardetia litoralis (strain ATCC 23117 / DSM 6794 / NBRC 15988 / NCIMB 1366 / Fx l1 / Sio-4) TaxID=880071 RepID=I4AIY0_BERLS|nr:phytoene/squalene synthetase [Bernardetia litoralis DSM 6794]